MNGSTSVHPGLDAFSQNAQYQWDWIPKHIDTNFLNKKLTDTIPTKKQYKFLFLSGIV